MIQHDKLEVVMNLLPDHKQYVLKEVACMIDRSELNIYLSNNFTCFASDASISRDSTGCGVYSINLDQRFLFRISHPTSSMFGELWSILKALEIAVEDGCRKIQFSPIALLHVRFCAKM